MEAQYIVHNGAQAIFYLTPLFARIVQGSRMIWERKAANDTRFLSYMTDTETKDVNYVIELKETGKEYYCNVVSVDPKSSEE